MITFAFKSHGFKVIAGRVNLSYSKENKERVRVAVNNAIEAYLEGTFSILSTLKLYLYNFKGLELKTYSFSPSKSHKLFSVRIHNGNKKSTVW